VLHFCPQIRLLPRLVISGAADQLDYQRLLNPPLLEGTLYACRRVLGKAVTTLDSLSLMKMPLQTP